MFQIFKKKNSVYCFPGVPASNLDSQCINNRRKMLFFLFFQFFELINLFLTALDLCCCSKPFLIAESRGYSLVAVHGFLIAVASLVELSSRACGLQ